MDDVSSGSSDELRSGEFKQGDCVRWKTAQGKATGPVKQKLTLETDIKGYTSQASEDDPQ
ncbi:MAG: DUF2945 domain-containing protein [Cyanobacteria bacterium J06632_3]